MRLDNTGEWFRYHHLLRDLLALEVDVDALLPADEAGQTLTFNVTSPSANPDLQLPDTDGTPHALDSEGSPATVVVFTCNHCPYALAWQERLHQAASDYAGRGVRFLAVNSNRQDTPAEVAAHARRAGLHIGRCESAPARRIDT